MEPYFWPHTKLLTQFDFEPTAFWARPKAQATKVRPQQGMQQTPTASNASIG
jgi:hypothetical protein